jgi:hypothetical protein
MENKSLVEPQQITENTTNEATTPPSVDNKKMWLKRVGVGGFLFFLGKGLLWLFLGKTALQALCN